MQCNANANRMQSFIITPALGPRNITIVMTDDTAVALKTEQKRTEQILQLMLSAVEDGTINEKKKKIRSFGLFLLMSCLILLIYLLSLILPSSSSSSSSIDGYHHHDEFSLFDHLLHALLPTTTTTAAAITRRFLQENDQPKNHLPIPIPTYLPPANNVTQMSLHPGLVILGMHRSGTSLLAGLMHHMGLEPGGPLLNSSVSDNPKGYFERLDINNNFMS
eukprot:scaffold5245_cov183-Ochromonas_danica.AAC.2